MLGNADRNSRIVFLYRDGKMIKDIAKDVGLAPNSIVGILRKLGFDRPVKTQKCWRDKADIVPKVAKLWDSGLCASQIAERLNCSRGAIETTLSKLKIRDKDHPRTRYDSAVGGGAGRSGFAAAMHRKT